MKTTSRSGQPQKSKTLLQVLSTVFLLALASCVTERPQSRVQAPYVYTVHKGAITITAYAGPGGYISIPTRFEDLPVTSIGKTAFANCTNLTAVTIPDTVTQIEERAFEDCYHLTELTIPDRVTRIGKWAFIECNGLTNVRIPASVIHLDTGVFDGCRNLDSIEVDRHNACYCSENGVVFSKDKRTLVQYPCGRGGDYVIPTSVTAFASCAFDECRKMTGVTIPNGITAIPTGMFMKNNKLTRITIPNSVTNIGEAAFYCCYSLSTITIPASVINIDRDAFNTCRVLNSVYFQGNAPRFDSSLFDHSPENVTIYYVPGTTGWEKTFAERPTAVWNPQQSPADTTPATAASKWYFSTPLGPTR